MPASRSSSLWTWLLSAAFVSLRIRVAESADWLDALALLCGAETHPTAREMAVQRMHADAVAGRADLSGLYVAVEDRVIVAALLTVPSPDQSVAVIAGRSLPQAAADGSTSRPPAEPDSNAARLAGDDSGALWRALFDRAQHDWRQRTVNYAHALTACEPTPWSAVLEDAQFEVVTQVQQWSCDRLESSNSPIEPPDEWLEYRDEHCELFVRTLQQTYESTQDFPELLPLRTAEQALRAHRQAGVWRADWWCLLREAGQAVGVVLMNDRPADETAELVYLGVTAPARRRGIGKMLATQAMRMAANAGRTRVEVYTDARNTSAEGLYTQLGFTVRERQSVWMWTPAPLN